MTRAFTLIEILVSIAIFSGLIILSIGVFARSANSANKANDVREQTQVTRSIIDQIASDLRYVDLKTNPPFCGNTLILGFCSLNNKELRLLIKYPGDSLYTAKLYTVNANAAGRVRVSEKRECEVTDSDENSNNDCPKTLADFGSPNNINTGRYLIDDATTAFNVTAKQSDLTTSGSVSISITTKSSDKIDCTNLKSGERCYNLKTTIVPGVY